MLVIRLQRTGKKNAAAYRLVVTEKTSPVRGKVKEYLGYYLPTRNPHVFECDTERVDFWVSKGAQPSNTAARLLKHAGVKNMDSFIKTYTKKKKKNAPEEEEKEEKKEEVPSESSEEDDTTEKQE